jgi:hypothetical protein
MWYRLSAQGYSQAVTKSFRSVAEALVRRRLYKVKGMEPNDNEVQAGINRVMREIERTYGPLHRAAAQSPDVTIRPVVEAVVAKLKW